MGQPNKQESQKHDGLLSLRVDEAIAREFRAEAARRGMWRNDLFLEIWELYKEKYHVTA